MSGIKKSKETKTNMASSSLGLSASSRQRGVGDVVVWEWLNELGQWRPYDPDIVIYIEKTGHMSSQVLLGTVSQNLRMYVIDIPSMCQIRQDTGTSRPVRRVIYAAHSPAGQQVMWEWEGDSSGSWHAYDMELATFLEAMQQQGQTILNLSTSQFRLPYYINFSTMQQIRIETGKTRTIRRSALNRPYPRAAGAASQLSKLTSITPASANLSLSSGSQTLSQPSSSSARSGRGSQVSVHITSSSTSSLSTSPSSVSVTATGTSNMPNTSKRMCATNGDLSNSDSESDDMGSKLHIRTSKRKRMKKSNSQHGAAAGTASICTVASGSSMSAHGSIKSGSVGAVSSKMSSGQLPVTSSSSTSAFVPTASQTSGCLMQAGGPRSMQQQAGSCQPSNTQPFSGSNAPLASVAAPASLPLFTYPQPLAANLLQGFPPMTHVPSSQGQTLFSGTQNTGHTVLQQMPSQHVSANHALSQHLALQHHATQQLPLQHPTTQQHTSVHVAPQHTLPHRGLPHPLSHHALPHVATPQQFAHQHASFSHPAVSGNWPGLQGGAMPQVTHGISTLPSSQAGSSSIIPPSSGQSQMQTSSYQGPITRNRLSALQTQSHQMGGGAASVSGGLVGLSNIGTSSLPYLPNGFGSVLASRTLLSTGAGPHNQHQLQGVMRMNTYGCGGGPSYVASSLGTPSLGNNILPQPGLPISSSKGSHSGRVVPAGSGVGLLSVGSSSTQHTESLPPQDRIILTKMKKSKPKTAEEVLNKYMEKVGPQENADCCICCDTLTAPSSYGEGKPEAFDVIQLNKCSHMYHRLCLLAMYSSSHNDDSIQCPTCKTIYGEYLGNCPPGEMTFDIIQRCLPGYPDCHTIRVLYNISPGVQGPEHPHPGRRFTSRGFPRVGYLPDNDRGRKILKMLIVAFKRRLMFTIGVSATTGEVDTVTWNEIHHKTEFGSNVSGHGYPDPNYLDNVTAELAAKGVTQQDL